eukprot:4112895-Pyramimonas_sp.AAC.1
MGLEDVRGLRHIRHDIEAVDRLVARARVRLLGPCRLLRELLGRSITISTQSVTFRRRCHRARGRASHRARGRAI